MVARLIRLTQTLLSVMLLVACGGGGGGGGSSSAPPVATAPYGLTSAPSATLNFPNTGAIGSVQLQQVAAGFNAPVFFTVIPVSNGRYAVVEQGGTIKVLSSNFTTENTLLDISSVVLNSGEQGLLGLAFDPDIATMVISMSIT